MRGTSGAIKSLIIVILIVALVAGALVVYFNYIKPEQVQPDEIPSGVPSGDLGSGDNIQSGDNVGSGDVDVPSVDEPSSGDVGSGDIEEPEKPTEPSQPIEPEQPVEPQLASVTLPFKYNAGIKECYVFIPALIVNMEDGQEFEFYLNLTAKEEDNFRLGLYSLNPDVQADGRYVSIVPVENEPHKYKVTCKYVENTLVTDDYFISEGIVFSLVGNEEEEFMRVFIGFYYKDVYVVV